MATTGFWPVKGKLKAVINYAENPDKTTAEKYLDNDLYAALRYTENDEKTDHKIFVTGINCSKYTAYEQMMATKQRFGKLGGNICYHGFQSFAVGEVTPEECHQIGIETAKRMWGNEYEIVVTTHLDKEHHLHNHFIVNSVSFKTGKKFENHISDHYSLREISDEICKERSLSVLENSSFYDGEKNAYWLHQQGKKTHRDLLKEDIEYCLSYSSKPEEFIKQLRSLGYEIDTVRMSVKAKGWQRAVRLSSLGFTTDVINDRLRKNRENAYFYTHEWNYHLPYKPKKFPLESEMRGLQFAIEHGYNAATVLIDTMFLLLITIIKIVQEVADVMLLSPDLRYAARDFEEFHKDYRFLKETEIHTLPELSTFIDETKTQITELEQHKSKISNQIRRPKSMEEQAENKERRKEITKQIQPLREKLRRAEKILEKSPHLYELLKTEHALERAARNRYLERN